MTDHKMKSYVTTPISWKQVVELVNNLIIDNVRFDVNDCCLHDAEILRGAANMIERELKLRDGKQP